MLPKDADTMRVVQVIILELQKINIENIPLSEATDITTDLHIDSLAVMEMIFTLEDRFNVTIPLNDLADVRTIGQIAQMVARKKLEMPHE